MLSAFVGVLAGDAACDSVGRLAEAAGFALGCDFAGAIRGMGSSPK